jgi:hypothetical protein
MDIGVLLINNLIPLLLIGLLMLIGFLALPRLANKPAPTRKNRVRLRRVGSFVGNALMPLHALVHPHVKYVIAEKAEEYAEDRDADPTDPMTHLWRQLKPIRNGEKVERLTTLKR